MTSKNQSGITSVMFALVFSAVLTMIAIGFAFVVRNDQRQTLDRYLSYQAQYAAESGVNQAINAIRTAQATPPGDVPPGDSCQTYDLSGDGTVKATCVTWSTEADYIYKESLGSEPFISKLLVDPDLSTITITWQKKDKPNYGSFGTILPDIDSSNVPILRFSIMARVGATYDSTTFKQLYIVPSVGGGSISLTSVGASDGSIVAADCTLDGTCSMTFSNAVIYQPDSVLSLSAIGEVADWVKIEAYQGGTRRKLKEAQITIDSNAIAQDVTKRVQARIPFMADTWNPGFVAAANEICKDIKIDGTNGTSISGGPVCPKTTP